MASQLDKVFKAEPKSVHELFLSKGTVGFYIPAYQREYSWDENNINRLIEDICQGISTFSEHEDAITFIGTVICILDSDHQTIKPYVHGELPSEVMSVIDGQQRLTTLVLIATCLYQSLSNIFHELSITELNVKNFFENNIRPTLNRLKQILELDRYTNDPVYRYYPKIIRAYVDQWASNKKEAKYLSPIASYLFDFIKYYKNTDSGSEIPATAFNHSVDINLSDYNEAKYARVMNNANLLQKRLDSLFKKGGDDTYHFPAIEDILNSTQVQHRLVGQSLPFDLSLVEGNGKASALIVKALRALIFSKFFLERVAITSVVANNETYAFDMFEALNTTGEPLTAFETFKPKVIDAEGVENYEDSETRRFITKIDNILDKYKKAEEKHAATTRLLTPFRLAFEGESLSKHLSEQRRFLNKAFDSLSELNEKQKFIKWMHETAHFLEECWPAVKSDIPCLDAFNAFDKERIIIKLDMLRQANHNIVIGILSRYFSKFLNSARAVDDFKAFESVLKVVVGFFIAWRSTRQGTDNIDGIYRDLLKNGVSTEHRVVCKPICITKCSNLDELPTVQELQAGFTYHLSKKLSLNKDSFVRSAKNIQIYKNNRSLTNYILLLTSNDTVVDLNSTGCLIKGVEGVSPTYSFKNWKRFSTIEHIYPQTPASSGWSQSLSDLASPHVLGNLVLLPSYINSSLGNRPWKEKSLIYRILSAKTTEQRNILISEAMNEGVELSFSTEEIVLSEPMIHQVESISLVNEMDHFLINKRSENLYGLVWDSISVWLGIN